MMRATSTRYLLGLAAVVSCLYGHAQIITSTTDDLVNTTTANAQQNPAVAMDSAGNYMVVWESDGQDGDGYGIYAQIYNADHTVRVAPYQINSTITGDQRFPDVAWEPTVGYFTVVWQSSENYNAQGWDCYRRLYDVDGTAITTASRLNSTTAGDQMHPKVDGGNDLFVATWSHEVSDQEFRIDGRYFNGSGVNLAAVQTIAETAGTHINHPDVGVSEQNMYVYTWQEEGTDGDGEGVYASVYDASHTLITGSMLVNTTTSGNQEEPAVVTDSLGNFVISWSSFGQDGDHFGIYAQRYDNTGATLGLETQVATTTAGAQGHSSMTRTREGKVIFSWTDDSNDGDRTGVYARHMKSDGTLTDADRLINSTTTEYQQFSSVAQATDATDLVVVWQGGDRSTGHSLPDNDFYGVYRNYFRVQDTTPPNANCQNITVYLDGSGNASHTAADIDNGSTDNWGTVYLSASPTTYTCADLGFTTSTLTVTDDAGNTDQCISAVQVVDTVSPTAVCQNLTLYLDGTGNASIFAADLDNGSTDNCGTVTLTASQTSFTCADVGTVSVTLTATDGSGNTDACTSTVTVIDSVTPTAVCQNLTVYLDGSGNANITPGDVDNGSTDNCGSVSLTASQTSFSCATTGANTVTLTVIDGSGNTSTCTSTVTVIDSVTPTASCQNMTVYLDGSGNATITAGDVDAGSSDNCSVASTSIDVSSFTCANIGANTVTLTVTDVSGNTSSCTSTVTVVDTVSPVASCQNMTVYLDGSGNATITAADIDNGSTDNCSVASTLIDVSSFACANIGANTVTLTVTDVNGNANACTSTVTVMDTTTPVFAMCPSDINIIANAAGCSADVTWTPPTVNDNCSVTTTSTHDSGDNFPIGSTTVTYTTTDDGGNTATCSFVVTVTSDLDVTVVDSTGSLCWNNSTGTAQAVATGGAGMYTYQWTNGETGSLATALSGGDHTVTVTDSVGCTATDDVFIPSPLPMNLSANVTDETFGNDGSIDLSVTGGTPGYTYDWSNGETTQDLFNLISGTYSVVVTDTNGCQDSLTVFVGSTVGIPDVDGLNVFLDLHPNPNSGLFTVRFTGDWKGEIDLSIVDSKGKLIFSDITTSEEIELNVSGRLEYGVYYLDVIDSEDNRIVRRFVVAEPQ